MRDIPRGTRFEVEGGAARRTKTGGSVVMFDWLKLPALRGLFGSGGSGAETTAEPKRRTPPPPRPAAEPAVGGGAAHDMADVFSGVVDGQGIDILTQVAQQQAGNAADDANDVAAPAPAQAVDPLKTV